MSQLTDAQERAVAAEGNLLVLAGAGTGKTKTLVERCVVRLLDPSNPAGIDDFLMVTFTEAAAAEMKGRVREALMAAINDGNRSRVEEQLALLATANIGTLHSFCLKLVRQHFHQLELDPQLNVLEEGAARLMMEETLDDLLEAALRRPTVRELAEAQGGEYSLRRLLLRLHDYTQTLADPPAWFEAQTAASPKQWEEWLLQSFEDFKAYWIPVLQEQPKKNDRAHLWASHFQRFGPARTREKINACLTPIVELDWKGKKQLRKAVERFYDGVEFLHSLCVSDALREDWAWTRPQLETLIGLAQEFTAAYSARKRNEAVLDFHDFEQFTLRLLAGAKLRPFKYVLVDECQDINAAQDAILQALSGESLFLVGDVKQSIYRFRLADPRIFQNYKARWAANDRVIPLVDNFRSRGALLDFVNPLFEELMQFGIGGVLYGEDAKLRCARETSNPSHDPAVEAHFLRDGEEADEEDDSLIAELTRTEKEAGMVARRLRELHESGAFDWRDMVVLMRSPANKAETYAKEFSRWNIPLQAEQGDFYGCAEISDLLSLLQVLDNPLQDVPLLAVLRSPMVGLSLDELANVRLANPRGHFWKALARWHEIHPEPDSKVSVFLKRFSRWRQISRETSLSQRLETIINETFYLEWLHGQPRADQRLANVRHFLALAQQFDPLQRHGLKRFLRFVEGRREAEVNSEPVATSDANAVRLMSIHKSKGLEFPVVVVSDLAKPFNFSDLCGPVLLDEVYGLCAQVKPPHGYALYPSLPHWLASQRQRRECIGEELRLLYVAATRARDRLILTSAISSNTPERWGAATLSAHKIICARSYIEWIGPWLARRAGRPDWLAEHGRCDLFEWFIWNAPPQRSSQGAFHSPRQAIASETNPTPLPVTPYPHAAATREIATQRVTSLRKRMAEDDVVGARSFNTRRSKPKVGLSPIELGNAHHQFLQLMRLDGPWTEGALKRQAESLHEAGYLADYQNLNYPALLKFWQSDFGQRVLANGKFLHREIPFTARMSAADIKAKGLAADEYIIVRGAVDLAVILPSEVWVMDFKTDSLIEDDLPEALRIYKPQLQLYGRALERIYRRPALLYLHFLALSRTVEIADHQT